ncbi:MAG: hypothetical protein ACOYES_09005, partial [Bacillota bacterium]
RLSCGIVAGVLQLRTEAAAPDELLRNRWTIWAGISGRIAPESGDVDDLGRNMQFESPVAYHFYAC